MTALEEQVASSIAHIRSHTQVKPRTALILGSGLGDFADRLPNRTMLATFDIPHYPRATVEGHKGKLVFATLGDHPLLAFQGRIHFYESNNIDAVLYPIYLAYHLGISTLIVTNAAGGVNRTLLPGDLMIITDQINLTTLTAQHNESERTMLHVPMYSPTLIEKVRAAASEHGIAVKSGVYAGMQGPSYETAAEIEMVHRIGGDAVGMSTVLEVALASSLGMEVLGISCITNYATGRSPTKLHHEEVTEVANRVKKNFSALLSTVILSL
jgi:purine-nucleoside phosphorylase